MGLVLGSSSNQDTPMPERPVGIVLFSLLRLVGNDLPGVGNDPKDRLVGNYRPGVWNEPRDCLEGKS